MHLVPNANLALRCTQRTVRNYAGFNNLAIKPGATTDNDTSSPELSSNLGPDQFFSTRLLRRREDAREKCHSESEKRMIVSASGDAITRSQSNRGLVLQTLHEAVFSVAPRKKRRRTKVKAVKQSGHLASLHKSSSKSKTSDSPRESEQTVVGWKSEDWGEDKLAPPSQTDQDDSSSKRRVAPPHFRHPLPYTRRVEGLLESSEWPGLTDLPPPSKQQPIATLNHGLDRVLFNPGVHWLQDPRSRVYNFTPWLEILPNVKDFDFKRLGGFIKSSRDEDLWELAKREKRTFGGSTSSLTGILSHIYFLISSDKVVDTSTLSRHFQHESTSFTQGQRMPASVVLNYKDGVYAIDSDSNSQDGSKNVLTWMGTMLEKFLTLPREQFTQLMRSHSPVEENIDRRREAYRYAKTTTFVMRSQLDCQDSRLPGTGIFDIKTRAALPIRLDLLNFEENSGYLIRSLHGPLESFEKEYYDLIRSAFLKYSFQARIGNMDGVFIAYHNTARIFGFQYIPLDEMEERLFGGKGRGERVFEKCVGVLESVADEIIRIFPEQSLKCTFETLENTKEMCVWVEPMDWSGTGAKPIAQLDVTSTSYLNKMEVKGNRAVSTVDASWTLHWTVSRSSLSDDDIRNGLAAAKDRLFRAYNLPTGIGFNNMAEYWETLNFGGTETNSEAHPYNPDNFRKPGKNINMLRALSRAGKEETTRLVHETVGKQKVVWSEPNDLGGAVDTTSSSARPEDFISLHAASLATDNDVSDLRIDNSVDINGPTSLQGAPNACPVAFRHGERSAGDDFAQKIPPSDPLMDETPGSDPGSVIPDCMNGECTSRSVVTVTMSCPSERPDGMKKDVQLTDVEESDNDSFLNEQPSPQESESVSRDTGIILDETEEKSDGADPGCVKKEMSTLPTSLTNLTDRVNKIEPITFTSTS